MPSSRDRPRDQDPAAVILPSPGQNIRLDPVDARALVALRPFLWRAARYHRKLDHPTIRAGLDALEAIVRDVRSDRYAAGSVVGSVTPPSGWITSDIAAERLGITPRAITKAALNGRLRSVKVGRRWWIDPEVLR